MKSSMKNTHPDFVVIGAMKSASTSLASLLNQHPQIYVSPQKEPGFFSRDERYAQGIESYLQLYSDAPEGQLTGEASTCYTRKSAYPLAAKRLYDHAPNCKLIYIMRNPVKRAYSHYAFTMAERLSSSLSEPVIPYAEAIEDIEEIVDASNYIGQIKQYLEYFPSTQLHCVLLEDLVASEDQELRKICEYLKVEFPESPDWRMEHANAKGDNVARRSSKRLTEKVLGAVPKSVKNIVGEELRVSARENIQNFFSNRFSKSAQKRIEAQVAPSTFEEDLQVYKLLEHSIPELEGFLGKEIHSWAEYNSRFSQ